MKGEIKHWTPSNYIKWILVRVQKIRQKFYFHFQDYCDLIIWKVQFLDRHHLLIKFGSVDGGRQVSRHADTHPAFVAVYNMDTTEIVSFYQNSADELYMLFEQFCDHFYATSRNSMHMNFISSHSNNIHALEQLRSIKDKASSSSQFMKKMLSSLPFSCQSLSPSPYFDQSLFRFDDKLISATDRHKQSTDHPIKFILRRHPYSLRFKIKPGPEAGSMDGRAKKISWFLFHPVLPLALSVQQTLIMQPPLLRWGIKSYYNYKVSIQNPSAKATIGIQPSPNSITFIELPPEWPPPRLSEYKRSSIEE
ncbi:hypothetical protein Ahy_A05g024770 isoform F [Arachis hypogaea]|uniref:Light-mediated development protein DET1 n=1 Tax=Arachis hypogaea TaxID=3818 RepID=A0A445D6P2_ARAHY|nr:hypothetical protein Ahy_A05g024770 isoform F [Arachis hypogaea]